MTQMPAWRHRSAPGRQGIRVPRPLTDGDGMRRDARVFVAGGSTLPGRALIDLLRDEGFTHLVGTGGDEPNLRDATATDAFFAAERPECVFLCAGKSGGIGRNRACPVE